jgi:hypothetical protein
MKYTIEFWCTDIYPSTKTMQDCPDPITDLTIEEVNKITHSDGVFQTERHPDTGNLFVYAMVIIDDCDIQEKMFYTDRTNF